MSLASSNITKKFGIILLVVGVSAGLLSLIGSYGNLYCLFTDSAANSTQAPNNPSQKTIDEVYGRIEMAFEPNTGNSDKSFDFLARGAGYAVLLRPDEAVFALSGKRSKDKSEPLASAEARGVQRSELRIKFVGANPHAAAIGAEELPGKVNYLIGSNPDRWSINIPTYGRVRYQSVYPGIDVEYYGNHGQLEYDFRVAPGADYRNITLNFAGADSLTVEEYTGDLIVEVGGRTVRQHRPVVYQEIDGERREIESRLAVGEGENARFELGGYDPTVPIVIDPVLVFSTFFGGNGHDIGQAIAVDSTGAAYITGSTASSNFPTVGPSPEFDSRRQ